MTRTGRRRFPIRFVLAGAALALLFSPVQAKDGFAPAKPTGLTAAVSHDSVTLTWDDPQDDSITGYVILRRNRDTDAEGQFTELVADTGSAATAYTDDSVAAETPYTYRIKAINAHGVSPRSRWFHIDTPAAPEPTPEPESVSEGDADLPNDNSTPGRVAVGGSVTGAIGTAGDQDRFAVELEAGRTYQFDLTGSPGGGGTLPDTYFRAIYDSAGQYQAASYNDDFDGGRDSRVTFTPSEGGTYYARVSGDRDETGSYTLSLTDVALQHAALTHTRVAVAGGQRVSRPARVQTTFVSNLGQTDISRDTETDPSSPYAQQFETGSNPGGYTLTEIVVNIRDAQTGTPAFALYTSTSDDEPDTKVVDLSGDSSTAGEQSFTPASATTLSASTKYYIVFGMTSGTANLQRTSSDNIDSGASPGWDIAENSLFGTGTTWTTSGDTVEIAIKGTAVGGMLSTDATLSDLVVNDGNADLTLTPTFASVTTTYTASVVSTVTAVTVTPMTTDTGATIEYLDGDDATLDDAGTADGHQVTLAEGENVIKVKVTAADGNTTETYMVTVDRAAANNAPEFPSTTATRTVPENTAVNQNVGAAIPAATDADAGDTLTYSMEGADAASFTFEASTRQIQTSAALDYEAKPSYSVTIRVSDGTASATIDVTITVTDEDEPPEPPAPPTLTATSGSTTSLDVRWTEPGLNGGPEITGYQLQYQSRATATDAWSGVVDWTHTGTATMTTITGLTADTEYQVRVQALNGERPSDWSDSSDAVRTNANNAPEFPSTTATRTVPENTAVNQNVGAAIPAAMDADGDSLTYMMEGVDAASFRFEASTRQIQTSAALDYEAKPSYSVTVTASDGTATATIDVTITVTDEDEPPAAPAAPTVSATSGSTTSLDVSWTEPANDGKPPIASYDLRYRVGSSGSWTDGSQDVTGTTAAISALTAATEYQVEVRASNAEGDSVWSAAGTGSTNVPVNNAPAFSLATATRSIAENTAANQNVGAAIPAATDADGDTLEYTLEGTDAASFDIVSTSGQIRTKAGVTYDHETTSSYSVTVKADDGNGGTDTIAVTITVTDIDEPPDKPAKPTVTATVGSTTGLDVSWTEPGLNGGPEITGYQLQYQSRASATDAWSGVADWTHTGTATMTTITGLTADTEYQVRVQALNGEKPSDWSDSSDTVRTVTTDPDDVTLPILDADPVGMGGVCDRTLRIRDRILVLLKHRHSFKGGCGDVNETHLAKLKSLDLGRNSSTESAFTLSLQSDDFKGLVNLERLYMRETGLRSLPAGVFSGLARLDTLDLGKNQLRLLPAGVFSDLQALTRLDLSKNPSLLSPPFDEFEALPNLTKLRVDSVGRHQLEVVGNEALEVAAGGSVTYQLRLLAAPSFKVTDDNPLTIEVSSDTDGVVATPASLRFTRENWFRSQTVTVSALPSASGTAELAHEGSGTTTDSQGYAQSNYDFEDYPLPKVTVRVR